MPPEPAIAGHSDPATSRAARTALAKYQSAQVVPFGSRRGSPICSRMATVGLAAMGCTCGRGLEAGGAGVGGGAAAGVATTAATAAVLYLGTRASKATSSRTDAGRRARSLA